MAKEKIKTSKKSGESSEATKTSSKRKPAERAPPPKSAEFVVDSSDSEKDGNDSDASTQILEQFKQQNPITKSTSVTAQDQESSSRSIQKDGDHDRSNGVSKDTFAESNQDQVVERNAGGEENLPERPQDEPRGVKRKAPHSDTMSRPPALFNPPSGFKAVNPPRLSETPFLAPFQASNLARKQIWHIIAPTKLPLSKIQEISLQEAKNGSTILEHDGKQYGLRQGEEGEAKQTRILVPNGKNGALTAVKADIVQNLEIHESLSFADTTSYPWRMLNNGTGAASCQRLPRTVPPPKQRKGLKMRPLPSLFNGEICSLGSSDSEEEVEVAPATNRLNGNKPDSEATFRKPALPSKAKPVEDGGHVDGEPAPKRKKKKTSNETASPEKTNGAAPIDTAPSSTIVAQDKDSPHPSSREQTPKAASAEPTPAKKVTKKKKESKKSSEKETSESATPEGTVAKSKSKTKKAETDGGKVGRKKKESKMNGTT
ncbi:MAG: hypothetical protein M1820_009342 [Bogoriella megaspora]|nr:MAG: hypothetical protein M1820_009342 [Bogoriella megaspora]